LLFSEAKWHVNELTLQKYNVFYYRPNFFEFFSELLQQRFILGKTFTKNPQNYFDFCRIIYLTL